ncbi:MAG: DNA mismatch repair endonuclease MutL [Anaerostipes sp.]|jgi:DNA mismatch repair protein MutL|nr:DNA mismatch repair endonuclease MutL [Anaerostipes sp.]
MSKIQQLDQFTIDNIAAGEVIERPASVIKELVENSIDASSSAITVEIKDGGLSMIRVTDNGIGIGRDDVKIAFLRHATSKIKTVEDLVSVSSLGFRGEALSSISAVSQVELITKTAYDFTGTSYKIAGGKEEELKEIGAPDGTTIIARNLFFNTPARRKFLKSPGTEASHVEQVMVHMALSHPEIAFKFIHNSKNRLYTSGNGNCKDMIYHIYGRDIARALIPVEFQTETMAMSGFIGKPFISRGNRNYESYFINGRYIKSKMISRALEDAYKTFTMKHKYPFVCLNFEIASDLLDVNVHPTKMEIRFQNETKLYDMIYHTVRDGLLGKDLIPEVTVEHKKEEEKPVIPKVVPEPFQQVNPTNEPLKNPLKKPSVYAGVNYKKSQEQEKPVQMTLNETMVFEEEAKPDRKIIGQLFQTFWLIEYEDNFFIMDQHAAHEKVNYEKLIGAWKKKEIYSQKVEPPYVVTLSVAEARKLERYKDAFAGLGFSIESFGGNEYCIREVPANLYGLEEKEVFIEVLDSMDDTSNTDNLDVITNKLASMACKMSVKGNQTMSVLEIKALLDELMELENPYTCPHGRPTMIRMTKTEIEKKFKRIV